MLIAGLAACTSLRAQAASDDATKLFAAGRAAFERQNYEAALADFEGAANSGMTGPAIHFNIGVAAYRLQRYARAEAAFREAARTPSMAAIAQYNLGLVALGAGDRSAATRWFEQVQAASTDERLRELASTQLLALSPQRSDRDRNWLAYSAVAAGYDDNVALVANSSVLGVSDVSDYFTELQLAVSAPLDQPWRFDAGLFALNYQDLTAFDQWGVNGSARYRFPVGRWNHEIGLQLGHTALDGDGMEDRRTLILVSRAAVSQHWQLRARYRFSDLDGLDEFDGLSGTRHEIDARVNRSYGSWDVLARYQFDINDYDDESLSSKRHLIGADLERELLGEWRMALELSWRYSDYDLAASGTENRAEAALSAIRSLGTRWRLIVRYAYADNDSDTAEFDYQRSRLSGVLEAVF